MDAAAAAAVAEVLHDADALQDAAVAGNWRAAAAHAAAVIAGVAAIALLFALSVRSSGA